MDTAALGILINARDITSAIAKLDQLGDKAEVVEKKTSLMSRAFSSFKSGLSSGFWGEIERGSKQGSRGVADLDSSMARATVTGGVFRNLLGSLFAGVSFSAVLYAMKSVIDSIDETAKTAQKIGLSANEFSKLSYAAQVSDVEVGGLETSLSSLNDKLTDIASGRTTEASRAFKAMGVSVLDANGKLKSTKTILGDVADKFASYNDGAQKTAISTALFGRAGRDMIPFLNQGAKAINDLEQRAEQLGVALSGDVAKDADRFNDAMTDMSFYIQGVARTAATEFLPTLNTMANDMTGVIPSARGLGQIIGNELKYAFVDAVAFFKTTGQELRALETVFTAVSEVIKKDFGFTDAGQKIWTDAMAKIRADAASTTAEIDELYKVAGGKGSAALKGISTIGRVGVDAPSYNTPNPKKPKRAKVDPDIADAKRLLESVFTPMEKHRANVAEYSRLLKEAHISQTTYNKAVGASQAEYVKAQGALMALEITEADRRANIDYYVEGVELARDTTLDFFSDLRGSIQEGEKLWSSLKNSALNSLNSIAQKLGDMAINGLFDGLLGAASHPLYGGGGGGGLVNSLLGGLFGGFRAAGGPMDGNKWHVVGERGPEIIPPLGRSASVIPNGAIGGKTGPQITYAPVMNFSSGMDAGQQRLFAERMRKQWERDLPSLLSQHSKNGAV